MAMHVRKIETHGIVMVVQWGYQQQKHIGAKY